MLYNILKDQWQTIEIDRIRSITQETEFSQMAELFYVFVKSYKRTTPGIPTWFPTVALTRPDDAYFTEQTGSGAVIVVWSFLSTLYILPYRYFVVLSKQVHRQQSSHA